LIEQAVRLDASAAAGGSELLRNFHWRRGDKNEARAWHERMLEGLRDQQAGAKERDRVAVNDAFEPHGLSAQALGNFCDALKKVDGLRKAFLVRKRVKHRPEVPLYVLGYAVTKWFEPHSDRRARDVLKRIQESVSFPGETLIISVDGDNRSF